MLNLESDIFAIVGIGSVDDVKNILARGIDINMVNGSGASLLHFAAFNSRVDVMDLLISNGKMS